LFLDRIYTSIRLNTTEWLPLKKVGFANRAAGEWGTLSVGV